MEIAEERRGPVLIVKPVGRLDSNTSEEFQKRLAPMVETSAGGLVVDLSAIDYVSSAGLRVLLLAAKRTKEIRGRMALSGMAPNVRQVFSLSGLLTVFEIEPDLESALARVTGASPGPEVW